MKTNLFEKMVGSGVAIDDPAILKEYSKDFSYNDVKEPVLLLKPESIGNVQDVIKRANELGTSIVPVSSSGPHFRGDTIPEIDNAVILDLSELNRVMWVNRRNRVTVIEPGVTFSELEPQLEKEGLRCMMPLLPKQGKSVIGAFMEREPFTVPKYSWDLCDPIASAEFVLGDGNTLTTGGGAGPGNLEQQREVYGAQKNPLGVFMMDVKKIAQGSQGSIGICTWASVRCELLPEFERVWFVGGKKLEDLIEFLYRSSYLKLVDEQYILNSLSFASLFEKDTAAIDALKSKLPNWILVVSVGGYGDNAKEQFNWKDADLKDEAQRQGVKLLSEIGGITEADYRDKIVRKSCDGPYWKLRYKGDVRELFFLTSASRTPEYLKMVSSSGFNMDSVGVYLQMVLQGRTCHTNFDFYGSTDELSVFKDGYTRLANDMFFKGAYYSRPYGPLSEIVYGHEGYKNFVKYARGVKDIFDPNHILNTGKLCF